MGDDIRTRVRPNNPDTSWHAARAQTKGKRALLQQSIHDMLAAWGPMTFDEIILNLPRWTSYPTPPTPSGVRTRTKELRELGWVRASRNADGETVKRPSATGHPATVWEVIPDGEVTGVDEAEDVLPERPDRRDFDNRQMRAAIEDVLTIHRQMTMGAKGSTMLDPVVVMAEAADLMANRLKDLQFAHVYRERL